jgi:hypothetical protein
MVKVPTIGDSLGEKVLATIEALPRVNSTPELSYLIIHKLSDSDRDYVIDCLNVVIHIYKIFGFDTQGYATRGTLHHWLYCASIVSPFKFMKWKFAAFYSAARTIFMKDPQDIAPSILTDHKIDTPHILLGGRAYSFMRKMARENIARFEEFITSLLFAKKGLPRPDALLVRQGEVEAFSKLTTARPQDPAKDMFSWADMNEFEHNSVRDKKCYLNMDLMKSELERTVIELFEGHKYSDTDRTSIFFPSTSANYINSRTGGGAVGHIMTHPKLLDGLTYKESSLKFQINSVTSKRTGITNYTQCSMGKLQNRFNRLYDRMLLATIDEVPLATPLGLSEATKVRVITKGPPLLNTVLKPVQKFLWRTLKKHPAFTLIGEWLSIEYLQSRLGKKLEPGVKFLSVDYSDATNELHSWCSEIVARKIGQLVGMTDIEIELFVRALVKHYIQDGITNEIKAQAEGQLMGSIVSFPILCIINAAILRLTKELDFNRLFTLRDSGIAINGDDALSKASALGVRLWTLISSFCGLKPSIGKVYYSDKFFNINSTTFNFDPNGVFSRKELNITDGRTVIRTYHYEHVKYVNMSLLYDLSRSQGANTNSNLSPTTFGSKCHELMRLTPDALKTSVMDNYIKLHLNVLERLCVPWFIPEYLGGLGLPIGRVDRHRPTNLQLRVAKKIWQDGLKVPSMPIDVAWNTWKLANKLIPNEKFPEKFISNSYIGSYGPSLSVLSSSDEMLQYGDDITFRIISTTLNETDESTVFDKYVDLTQIRALAVAECLFTKGFKDLFNKRDPNEVISRNEEDFQHITTGLSEIEKSFYHQLKRLNSKALKDLKHPVGSYQPFDISYFPKPNVKVDRIPFIRLVRFTPDELNININETIEL